MTVRILVAGVGNIFLCDDGFGPETARRLAERSPAAGRHSDDVRVVDYGIRGTHLAYDLLDGWDALVLVDAVPGEGDPGTIGVLAVSAEDLGGGEVDAHGMDPVATLGHLDALGGKLPPTYVVGCRPAETTDGIGLSPAVEASVDEAVVVIESLVSDLLSKSVRVLS
ncbi:MAG: hydrogenase maturation protease [Nocardioidaceae bacterium]